MINKLELINYINSSLQDIDKLVESKTFYKYELNPVKETLCILNALKNRMESNIEIETHLLRACHNLGLSSFKAYENTALEDSLVDITGFLRRNIKSYSSLLPLGVEYSEL